jgi:hypothetical protein
MDELGKKSFSGAGLPRDQNVGALSESKELFINYANQGQFDFKPCVLKQKCSISY